MVLALVIYLTVITYVEEMNDENQKWDSFNTRFTERVNLNAYGILSRLSGKIYVVLDRCNYANTYPNSLFRNPGGPGSEQRKIHYSRINGTKPYNKRP